MLQPLGVTQTAEDLYRTLLKHGPTAEARLAELVGITPDTAQVALEELRGLGLARLGPGSCWHPESPDVTLASLVVREQETLLERQRDLDRVQSTVTELVRLSRTRTPTTGNGVVEISADIESTARRCGHLSRTTEHCIQILDRSVADGPVGGVLDALPEGDIQGAGAEGTLALVGRGVDVQSVYERGALLAPGRFDALRHRAAAGEQARTLPSVPMAMTIFDRSCAVVQLDEGTDGARSAVFVHRSPLLDGLVGLFDLLWDRAVPVPPEPNGEIAQANGAEFDDVLVALLAAGFKDESIARHLGISPSTVTRRMARLMDLAGTSTRFQLGMQAARRGWI